MRKKRFPSPFSFASRFSNKERPRVLGQETLGRHHVDVVEAHTLLGRHEPALQRVRDGRVEETAAVELGVVVASH